MEERAAGHFRGNRKLRDGERSLSHWERVGVRGYGLDIETPPHPTVFAKFIIGPAEPDPLASPVDLSPAGRGEANFS
jgi:hypothetical protein